MVWAYIARATNDPAAADDLLQEAYFRFLRSKALFESDDHRRNYLFRIATNLIRDRYRRPRLDSAQLPEHGEGDIPASGDLAQPDPTAHRSSTRDGAAVAPRARARVACVRAGIDASGNRRRARIENRQHQAAAVSRTAEACEDSCGHDVPRMPVRQSRSAPQCGPLVLARRAEIRREFERRSGRRECRRRKSSGGGRRCARARTRHARPRVPFCSRRRWQLPPCWDC